MVAVVTKNIILDKNVLGCDVVCVVRMHNWQIFAMSAHRGVHQHHLERECAFHIR